MLTHEVLQSFAKIYAPKPEENKVREENPTLKLEMAEFKLGEFMEFYRTGKYEKAPQAEIFKHLAARTLHVYAESGMLIHRGSAPVLKRLRASRIHKEKGSELEEIFEEVAPEYIHVCDQYHWTDRYIEKNFIETKNGILVMKEGAEENEDYLLARAQQAVFEKEASGYFRALQYSHFGKAAVDEMIQNGIIRWDKNKAREVDMAYMQRLQGIRAELSPADQQE